LAAPALRPGVSPPTSQASGAAARAGAPLRIPACPPLSLRRFPPLWVIEEHHKAYFIVKEAGGQVLAYVYFEEEPGGRSAAKLLTKDEARMAANFAKLPDLLRREDDTA
jgi:hypothetical protein